MKEKLTYTIRKFPLDKPHTEAIYLFYTIYINVGE